MITRIAGEERQILDTIIRKTYGWNKKEDWISLSSFEECTAIKQRNVRRALKRLIEKKIVSVNNEQSRKPKYSFNKLYNEWVSVEKKTGLLNNDLCSIMSLDVVNNEHKEGSIMTTTIDTTKDIIQKISIADLKEIFNYWNGLGIIKHKVIDKYKVHLIKALKDYSLEELKEAMLNFKTIIEGKEYYWNHRWGLGDFLTRKNGIDTFTTVNKPFENFKKDKKGSEEVKKAQGKSSVLKLLEEHERSKRK